MTEAELARWESIYRAEGDQAGEALIREIRRLQVERQDLVDSSIHYRNLAISLGAKPDDMACKYDRDLCSGRLCPVDEVKPDTYRDAWSELDQLEAKLAELRRRLDAVSQAGLAEADGLIRLGEQAMNHTVSLACAWAFDIGSDVAMLESEIDWLTECLHK